MAASSVSPAEISQAPGPSSTFQNLDDAVLGIERVAARPVIESRRFRRPVHADGLGELGARIPEKGQTRCFGAGILGPGGHDEGIVDRNTDDLVHPAGVEIGLGADEAGHMRRAAGARVGAGQAEDHDLAAPGLVAHLHRLGPFGTEDQERGIGQRVADGNGHLLGSPSLVYPFAWPYRPPRDEGPTRKAGGQREKVRAMERIVVVGAGQAGASCVAKLRSEGFHRRDQR